MVRFIIESIKQHIKCEIEYKASFLLGILSNICMFFSYYFMILALFNKFDNIKGFNVYEVLLCFSIIQFGFSINETFFRGIDKFEDFIIKGELDRLLLRPRNVLFQLMLSKMHFVKITRCIQALIILVISLINLDIDYSIGKVILLIVMFITSVMIFFGLFLLAASYCFYTVQGLEVKNLMTDGCKHMAQYPIGIFRKGIKFVFTFIVPFAVVNYYPLLYFVDKSDNVFYMISPIFVLVFLIPIIMFFNYGLKHYTSVGS